MSGGNLLVANEGNNTIDEYNAITGATTNALADGESAQ